MLADFSIAPVGKGHKGLGKYVAKITKLIRSSGLPHQLHSMGTLVEGNRDEVFDLIKRCHKAMLKCSDRVYTIIKIDDRKGATGRLKGKVKSVLKHL